MIILINAYSAAVYSAINDTNNTKGFYFTGSLYGQYEPTDTDVAARFFYRMPMLDIDHTLFDNTKLEFGIEGGVGFSGDFANVYIDVTPIDFFRVKTKAGWISYRSLSFDFIDEFNFGFYTFDKIDATYSKDVFSKMEGLNKNGYFVEIEPTFIVDILQFTLISSLNIMYQDMFVDNFYYDRFTYLLRENKTVSFVLNNYLMFNISPLDVGLNYTLIYVEGNKLAHKVGVAASFYRDFSDIIAVYGSAYCGQYISYNYLTSMTYIEGSIGLQVKIF